MTPILRIDGTTQEIVLGLDRGCAPARLAAATLTVQLAGRWPRMERTYEEVVTECGVQRLAVDTPVSPPVFTMTAVRTTEQWQAVFVPAPLWLAAPDGRYDGTLTTECGAVPVRFQKGGYATARNATPAPLPCGDAGAVCDPLPPAPPLSLPTYTATYRLSGWTRHANGYVFQTDTGQPGQQWPTVEPPYDTLGAQFTAWSDGVPTRTRPLAPITGDLDVTAQYTIPNVTATYLVSGHGLIPNGVFQTVTVQAFQNWPDVTAPADGGGTVFQQWSDGHPFRLRNDGQAAVNRPPVTAQFGPAAVAYRLDFESDTLPSGFTGSGFTRTGVGGVVCTERQLQRLNGDLVMSTALGGFYIFGGNSGFVTITTTNTPFTGVLSFFYNSTGEVDVWGLVNGSWVFLDWVDSVALLPQACSRNRWKEAVIQVPGSCTAVQFQGVSGDFAIDNLTLGHNDPLGALP